MQNKAIQQYLAKYADAEVRAASEAFSQCQIAINFNHCIVVPALAEEIHFLTRWLNVKLSENNLLVLVLNQHQNTSVEKSKKNTAFFEALIHQSEIIVRQQNIHLLRIENRYICLVDRFRDEYILQEKHGVGHARKIGCDIAVQLIQSNIVESTWIYSTDADAYLPENYFANTPSPVSKTGIAAKVFEFTHIAAGANEGNQENTVFDSTKLYEKAIKYYRNALAWAGSPYGFYTLGSTVAIKASAYCQVRGFPKRAGAEDFYLLNKLAKVGRVVFEPDICIKIQARVSDRVPFGTGPAVEKIMALNEPNNHYTYYNPQCFIVLKYLFDNVNTILSSALITGTPLLNAAKHQHENSVERQLEHTLQALGIMEFCQHARKQCRIQPAVMQQFNQWFDGFLTLKFIRHLQQHFYPALEINTCLEIFNRIKHQ